METILRAGHGHEQHGARLVKQWPCQKCSAQNLCDDCVLIKRAEDRQRREIRELWTGRASRAWDGAVIMFRGEIGKSTPYGLNERLKDGFATDDDNEHEEQKKELPDLWDESQENK